MKLESDAATFKQLEHPLVRRTGPTPAHSASTMNLRPAVKSN